MSHFMSQVLNTDAKGRIFHTLCPDYAKARIKCKPVYLKNRANRAELPSDWVKMLFPDALHSQKTVLNQFQFLGLHIPALVPQVIFTWSRTVVGNDSGIEFR
jgi:hypothetical protein